jgi:hypothetical protein
MHLFRASQRRQPSLSSSVFRLSSLAAIAALTSSVQAALPVVYTDTSNLLPNTPNQVVHVYVTGTDQVAGEDLNFQINSAASGPTFTSVDIITGTIFAPPNNTGQSSALSQFPSGIINGTYSNHLALVNTTTDPNGAPSVLNNGLLATLLISTDASSGTAFVFDMVNTVNGPSTFGTLAPALINVTQPHNLFSIGTPVRQWNVNSGGAWDTNSNWTPFAPYAQGDVANFLSAVSTGTANITLDGVRTVGAINFNNAAASYSLLPGAGGSILLNNGASAPSINSSAGSHVIAAPISLSSNTSINVAAASTLTISGNVSAGSSNLSMTGAGLVVLSGSVNGTGTFSQSGSGTTTLSGPYSATGPMSLTAGKLVLGTGTIRTSALSISPGTGSTYLGTLDVANHNLVVDTTGGADKSAKLTALQQQITAGRNGGNWQGTGITSSTVVADIAGGISTAVVVADNADLNKGIFGNATANSNSLLIQRTVIGDGNLDGLVTIADFLVWSASAGKSANVSWSNGDYNQDGLVTIADFLQWSANAGKTLSGQLNIVPAAPASGPVPEPASLSVLALGSLYLLQGRRRRSQSRPHLHSEDRY